MKKKRFNVDKPPPHECGQPSYQLQDGIYIPDPVNYHTIKHENYEKVQNEISRDLRANWERWGMVDEEKLQKEV